MPVELLTLPCLADNYVFLLHNPQSGQTAVVDVPDADVVLEALQKRGWTLNDILITHHHDDHINGVAAVKAATGARIVGAAADAHRLPTLDLAVAEGDTFSSCGENVTVMEVYGHTVGHIAFHLAESGIAATGDSLMALGCGRLFEGTPAQMWDSMQKFLALPPETVICSGHEYTASNAAFAATIEPMNAKLKARTAAIADARARGFATVPSILSEELETNPFLRAHLPSVKSELGLDGTTDAEVFAEIRKRKDSF